MKKINKIMSVLVILVALVAFVAPVFGVSYNKDVLSGASNADTSVSNLVNNIWGTVTLVVQVLAIACVVFAGLRYMFASADAKADIKKQTIILVVGAVLVFGATWIIQIIADATKSMTNVTVQK